MEIFFKRFRKMKNRKGFTLIELIVVIVIIGILAAIVIPRLAGFSDSAKRQADIATARTLVTAASTIYANNPSAPGTDYAKNGAIDTLLPTNFDWAAQAVSGSFKITPQGNGEFTIDAGTVEVYPNPEDPYN